MVDMDLKHLRYRPSQLSPSTQVLVILSITLSLLSLLIAVPNNTDAPLLSLRRNSGPSSDLSELASLRAVLELAASIGARSAPSAGDELPASLLQPLLTLSQRSTALDRRELEADQAERAVRAREAEVARREAEVTRRDKETTERERQLWEQFSSRNAKGILAPVKELKQMMIDVLADQRSPSPTSPCSVCQPPDTCSATEIHPAHSESPAEHEGEEPLTGSRRWREVNGDA